LWKSGGEYGVAVRQGHPARGHQRRSYERENRSENDVEIPPAFIITDSDGAAWTIGTEYVMHNGEFEFKRPAQRRRYRGDGERIVYRKRVVCIFGHYGWKRFSRSRRHFI